MLHGDGVPYGKGDHAILDVFSHNCMVAVGDIVDVIMLCWALSSKSRAKLELHGVDTYALIWKITVCDLECCARGEYSAVDWNGQPWPAGQPRQGKSGRLCGPYFMAWWQLGSDDEYLANYLGLPHWQNPSPCAFCNCNDTDNAWTIFSDEALWQDNLTTLNAWEAAPADHRLWRAWRTVGRTAFHICLEELHNGPHESEYSYGAPGLSKV